MLTGRYLAVEKLFRQTADWAHESELWQLNVAHVFFMQEKYTDAIKYAV
jgi:tetratricopeptide repeat protein 30